MRKVIILLLILFLETLGQDNFVRGVMAFESTKVDLYQLRDSLHLNWIHALVEKHSDGTLNYNILNGPLKIIGVAAKEIYHRSNAQRMVFKVDQSKSSIKNYFNFIRDRDMIFDSLYKLDKLVGKEGLILGNIQPDDEFRHGVNDYFVSINLKIEKKIDLNVDETDLINNKVVRVEVCSNMYGVQLGSIELRESDFATEDFELHKFKFSFNNNTKPWRKPYGVLTGSNDNNEEETNKYKADVKVFWYGKVTTWIDKIIIEDEKGENLFSGKYDSLIRGSLNGFASYNNLMKFYLSDEPPISSFEAYNYIQQLIDTIGREAITAQYANFEKFIEYAKPKRLFVDLYPIKSDIPNPFITDDEAGSVGIKKFELNSSGYTFDLQTAINDYYSGSLRSINELSKKNNIEFWVIPQLHGEYFEKNGKFRRPTTPKDTPATRPPTGNEVKLMCNLAVAYGAKGIFPYLLGTDRMHWSNEFGYAVFAGLLSEKTDNGIHRDHSSDYGDFIDSTIGVKKPIWVGYKDKWDALSEVMFKYKILSPILSNLTHIGTKNWSNDTTTGVINNYLLDVKSNINNEVKYIETGYFENGGEKYLFVVNRRTLENESRNISIKVNNPSKVKLLEISELIGKEDDKYISPDEYFTYNFKPAEGKLFKINNWRVNNLQITNSSGNVNLKWNAMPSDIFSMYLVERKINTGAWENIWEGRDNNFTDVEVRISNEMNFSYRVRAIKINIDISDYSNIVSIGGEYSPAKTKSSISENKFTITNNYPNPFNPLTKVEYNIPKDEYIKIKLYDLTGREVITLISEYKIAGRHNIIIDNKNLTSGNYILKISAGSEHLTKKITIIK